MESSSLPMSFVSGRSSTVVVEGTKEEQEALDSSYRHLCKLRDEVIAMGVLPPVADWHRLNHNID